MSDTSISAIQCDHENEDGERCDERRLVTDGMKEGHPIYSWLSRGWVKIEHRMPDDHLGITTTHYCPDHAPEHVDGDVYDG